MEIGEPSVDGRKNIDTVTEESKSALDAKPSINDRSFPPALTS